MTEQQIRNKAKHGVHMEVAKSVALLGTCLRRKVGCAIVRDGLIVSTGYNGSIRGLPHCTQVGCMVINNHCERTSHAEQNAVANAARVGVSLIGATAYVTTQPCLRCFRLLAQAGISSIFYASKYGESKLIEDTAHECGINLTYLPDEDLE